MGVRFQTFLSVFIIVFAVIFVACDEEPEGGCPPSGLSRCDPILQTCCEGGENCVLNFSSGSYTDTCLGGTAEAGEGDECTPNITGGAMACEPGTTCLMPGSPPATCHRLCRDDGDCTSGNCTESLPGISIRACVSGN